MRIFRSPPAASAARSTLLLAVVLATAGSASAEEPPLRGDLAHGEALFATSCAGCHGANGDGATSFAKVARTTGLGTLPDLRDSAFLAQRSDAQLLQAIREGVRGTTALRAHAFEESVSRLDGYDLVAWLRAGALRIEAFYPSAAKFTARSFTIDDYGLKRLQQSLQLVPKDGEETLTVLTTYAGKTTTGPTLVPWTPVQLDLLSRKDRLGFLTFHRLELPGERRAIPVGLAFGMDGKLTQVRVLHADAQRRAVHERELAAFVGQGAKKPTAFKAPRSRDGAAYAKILTRAGAFAAEAIAMYEKAERERTTFDR